MASAVDKQPAAARLAAVAAARCLPTATRGSQNSYTTSGDTTIKNEVTDTPSSGMSVSVVAGVGFEPTTFRL